MTRTMQKIVNDVLKPFGMSLTDLEVPRFSDIELLLGTDYAALQIEDNTSLNQLARPENLRFYNSPLMKRPLVVGCAYRQDEWTKAEHDVDMPDPVEEERNEQPSKEWNGFAGIRSTQEINLTKSDIP